MPKGYAYRMRRACRRKIYYAEEPPANERVRPYKCPCCDGWHMCSLDRPYFDLKPVVPHTSTERQDG